MESLKFLAPLEGKIRKALVKAAKKMGKPANPFESIDTTALGHAAIDCLNPEDIEFLKKFKERNPGAVTEWLTGIIASTELFPDKMDIFGEMLFDAIEFQQETNKKIKELLDASYKRFETLLNHLETIADKE